MIIESLLLSMVIGKIRGGQINRIANLKIKKWYLFIAAFILQYLLSFGYTKSIGVIQKYHFYFHLTSYILLFIGFAFNMKNLWLNVISLGVLLNAVVIFLNGGKMPVSLEAIRLTEMSHAIAPLVNNQVARHQALSTNMTAWYLGDMIPIIPPYPFTKVISIGDLVMSIGVFFLIQKYMKKRATLFS